MKKRMISLLLCLLLIAGISGCGKQGAPAKEREDSAGTGFGVTAQSSLLLQDLYFIRPNAARGDIEQALGSPQSKVLGDDGQVTYRLQEGQQLKLRYSSANTLQEAVYIDVQGEEKDLFLYLSELGILKNYNTQQNQSGDAHSEPEEQPEEAPSQEQEEEPSREQDAGQYFSNLRYRYEVAEQLLKLNAARETIVSALGRPNSYGSISYAKDSYITDVYYMDDGSILHLDYGYAREKLRAVQMEKNGAFSTYLGEWGAEEKPQGFYRFTRNLNVFSSMKKNMKPSEIYRRFGEPDWLEGNPLHYRAAYMLADGAVYYMDFGTNNNALIAVSMEKSNGSVTVYPLK